MPPAVLPLTGAVEGDLDEAVLRRVLEHAGLPLGVVHGRKGKQYLLQSMRGYNNVARFAPWMVQVDLDQDCACAPTCRAQWLPNPSARMLFRIVVRAIEAWLLSDRARISDWLRVATAKVSGDPENLADPKQHLIGFVPRTGSGRAVGPLYTSTMIQFVEDRTSGWRPEQARSLSMSLSRCLQRLDQLGNG